MNKTIIININGIVFHIEEQAYEILKNYMTAIKRHFFESEDSLEITTDIENRVAELFTEILNREGRQAIIDQDVNAVIGQMGAVEDFDNAATDNSAESNSYYNLQGANQRRLFRDPDDHLVAGVCAGIANYFDTQAVWIRLIFAACILFAGTGLFLYIILWIVLPKAATRADRMAMKGEKLNLQGFKRNFEEEATHIKERLAEAHHHAKPFIYRFRDFLGEFFSFLGKALGQTGGLLLKVIGICFMILFFGIAVVVIVAFFSIILYGHNDMRSIFPFNIIGEQYDTSVYTSAFFIIIIPLVAFIVLLARLVFNTTRISSSVGTVLLVLWICAVIMGVYYSAKISANFRYTASFNKTINIIPTKNSTYYLKLNELKFLTKADSARLDINSRFHGLIVIDNDEDSDGPNNLNISIEKSDVAQPVLVERYTAKGKTYDAALLNARNTAYGFSQQDTVLEFDRMLHRLSNQNWYGEEIELILKVPVSATVIVDQPLGRYTDMDEYDCRVRNKTPDASFTTFKMTNTGIECMVDTLKTDRVKIDSMKLIEKPHKPLKHFRRVR